MSALTPLVLLLAMVLVANRLLAQLLVRLVLVLWPSVRPGDAVTVGAHSGVVETVGWLSVRLRSPSGDRVSVPNVSFVEQVVVRSVSESGSQGVELLLPVPEGVDAGAARGAARRAASLSPYLALDRPVTASLEQGRDGELWVRSQAAVFDTAFRAAFETSVIEGFRAQLALGAAVTPGRGA